MGNIGEINKQDRRKYDGAFNTISSSFTSLDSKVVGLKEHIEKLETKLDNYNGLREKVRHNEKVIEDQPKTCQTNQEKCQKNIKWFVGVGFTVLGLYISTIFAILKVIK